MTEKLFYNILKALTLMLFYGNTGNCGKCLNLIITCNDSIYAQTKIYIKVYQFFHLIYKESNFTLIRCVGECNESGATEDQCRKVCSCVESELQNGQELIKSQDDCSN